MRPDENEKDEDDGSYTSDSDSDDSDGSLLSNELNELDELLEQDLPEDFRRCPKRRKLMPQEHDIIKSLVHNNSGTTTITEIHPGDDDVELEAGELQNSLTETNVEETLEGGGEEVQSGQSPENEVEESKDDDKDKYKEKIVLILEEKGKSKFDDLPGGWIQVRHVSGMPLYLHRKTRVCSLSKPYRLGPGSARRHSMPLSAIPCLAYKKALEREAASRTGLQNNNNSSNNNIISPISLLPKVEESPQKSTIVTTTVISSTDNNNPSSSSPTSVKICSSLQSSTPVSSSFRSIFSTPSDNGISIVSPPQSPTTTSKLLSPVRSPAGTTSADELEPGEIVDGVEDAKFCDSNSSKQFSQISSAPSISTLDFTENELPIGLSSIHKNEFHIIQGINDSNAQEASEAKQQWPEISSIGNGVDAGVEDTDLLMAKNMIPRAQVETAQEANELNSVSPDELKEYCMSLFKFKKVKCKRFKSWSDRRKHTKEQKKLHLQRPTLPDGVQLITFPVQRSGDPDSSKAGKEYTMNPQGKSSVCILHEYVQHALRMQPSYEFKETQNAANPYAATVMINNIHYGTGYGSSKKIAKAAAARATLEILIPKMKDVLKSNGPVSNDMYHIGYFDQIEMDDPRITKMCASVSEPSPYALLLTCLQRNFGKESTSDIKFEMIATGSQANRFRMETGEHSVEVTASNKREGKQLASQALLCQIHPHIKNFGSFLRLYGNGSIKSVKEKKQEEQQITTLQNKASANSPNYAILNKLKEEMLKLRKSQEVKKSCGKQEKNGNESLESV